MAMSRAEIELLIKAKNQAQQAFDQLGDQVRRITGESDKASESQDRMGKSTGNSGVAAGAASVAFGLLAERVGRALIGAFGDSIAAANRLDAGLIGLGATAKAFGTDAGAAQNAAKSLASDGLMSVGEAASSLKNLLAAGFNLPEAITLMGRFKDSAAFGRQGSLEFGQAIVGATEGIKNGNSALVDNAGLTKNLSNILVEAGFSAQDLSRVQSDVNVRGALFNGILKETNPQLGQTALYLDTAAGKQAQFNTQVEIAYQKLGKALQPALADTLAILAPVVQKVGDFAPVLVTAGTTLAAFVAPLIVMKSYAALGLPPITELTGGISKMMNTMRDTSAFGGFISSGKQVTDVAGVASAGLGKLGTATALAGAAFAGWKIGTMIDQLTGASSGVQKLTEKIMGWNVAAATSGAVQDVIDRAISMGADKAIKYADAIQYIIDKQVAGIKVQDDDIAGKKKQYDAQLALGQIDRARYDDLLILLNVQQREADGIKNSASLKKTLLETDQKLNEEIRATGLTMGELLGALDKNEDAFEKWAKQVGLSDEAVDKLKGKLKAQDEAHKKTAESAKKQAEAQKQLSEQLESMAGVITQQTLNEKLDKMAVLLQTAAQNGTPALTTAVKNLWPELKNLRDLALASGLNIGNLDGLMRQAAEGANLIVANVRPFNTFVPLMAGVTEANRVNTAEVRVAVKAQDDLRLAYEHFGLTTPVELGKVADASARNYQLLKDSGVATTAQLKLAYRQMVDDQKAATNELPGFWETKVFPSIKGVVDNLQTAVSGSFAQMLIGAKGFGEGWTDIWKSIKASTLNILNDIMEAVLNGLLKGILGALSGQQGAFSQAFGGLLGGGVGAGAGGGGLAGLFGLGGGAGAGGATGVTMAVDGSVIGGGTGAGAGGSAGLFGVSGAGLAGGAGAAGAGIGLGMLGKYIFDGAGWQAGAFGAAGGAGTGALIGSIVPGIGTAIGALIGGLAGGITGMIGKSQEERHRDQFLGSFGGQGTGEGSGFLNLAKELAKLSGASGGGEGGGSLFRNLIKADDMKEYEAALRAVTAALGGAEYATIRVGEATTGLVGQRDQLLASGQAEDAVTKQQAASFNELYQAIVRTGVEAPAQLQPIFQRMMDMGLLLDDTGQAVTDLGAVFPSMAATAAEGIGAVREGVSEVNQDVLTGQLRVEDLEAALLAMSVAGVEGNTELTENMNAELLEAIKAANLQVELGTEGLDLFGDAGGAAGPAIIAGLAPVGPRGEAEAQRVQDAFNSIQMDDLTVRYHYERTGDDPGPGSGPGLGDVPGAADGILASSPTLRWFGEGGEPELGGSVGFMSKALAGAMEKMGGAVGGGGDIYIMIDPSGVNAPRRMNRSDFKQIEAAAANGSLRIPKRAVVDISGT